MTAICNGGTSQAKPGLGTEVIIPTALISAGLALISPWLIPVAAVIEGYTFDLISGCGADPPALPVFDLTDARAAVVGVFDPAWNSMLAKVNNLIRYYFWYQYCQCSAPTVTPAPVSTVLPPAGVTATQVAGATPCYRGSYQGILPTPSHPIDGNAWQNITTSLIPVGAGPAGVPTMTPTLGLAYPVAAGATHLEWQYIAPRTTSCGPDVTQIGSVAFYPTLGSFPTYWALNNDLLPQPNTGSYVDIPPGTTYYLVFLHSDNGLCGEPVGPVTINMQTWCGTSRPGGANACCPADPSLINLTHQIYSLALSISQALPGAVRSYADATVHAGLTGAGSFTLHDNALALRCEVTAGLPVDRTYVGNPTYYFDVGHVTPLISGSPYLGSRLVYQKQLLVLPSLVDSIGYTFSNGVTVKITELVKGP